MRTTSNSDILQRHLLRTGVEIRTFDYLPQQWSEIAKSLESLPAKQKGIEEIRVRLRNSARSFILELLSSPDRTRNRRLRLKHWSNAERLSEALFSELMFLAEDELDNGPPHPDGSERKPFLNELKAVISIAKMTARAHLVEICEGMGDGFPKATPKARYQSNVLDVWTSLGGKLRFSRHPISKKIKGPLVRYFSAVTEPVYGGSPETLPDIIDRCEERKVALEKWRLEKGMAAGLNGEMPRKRVKNSPH